MIYNYVTINENGGVGIDVKILKPGEELPNIGESKYIYLKPYTNEAGSDCYEEFLWVDNQWERIGSTEITVPKPLYQHNIHLHFRGVRVTDNSVPSDSFAAVATFSIITEEEDNYSLIHNWRKNTASAGTQVEMATDSLQYAQLQRLIARLQEIVGANEKWYDANKTSTITRNNQTYCCTSPTIRKEEKQAGTDYNPSTTPWDDIAIIPASGIGIRASKQQSIVSGISIDVAKDKTTPLLVIQATRLGSEYSGIGDDSFLINTNIKDELKVVDTVVPLNH